MICGTFRKRRCDVGHQLNKVQHGLAPDDAKPMPTIGAGVMELRIWDEAGTFRVVPDIELARKRFKELVKEIQNDRQATIQQRMGCH